MLPHSTTSHLCSIMGCSKPRHSRHQFCSAHLSRKQRGQDMLTPIKQHAPYTGEFWDKVNITGASDCWEWQAYRQNGYGRFQIKGRHIQAHRYAYITLIGPIPHGLTLDHLCRNRACVNPAHLQPVTMRVNILRGVGITAQAARRTHCPQGHPYDLFNTHYQKKGSRICRACQRKEE